MARYLDATLWIEQIPESSFDEIVDKCVEVNMARFMEGNGRSIRIWLDMMLKTIKKCVDWSKIGKKEYLMRW